MDVRIKLFGPPAAVAGASEVVVRLEPGADEARVRASLASQFPTLAGPALSGRLAVNHEFARAGEPIRAEDELALIAMVSGG